MTDQLGFDFADDEPPAVEMELKLHAPGMTSLHKAGLAGLYMTLRAFDKLQKTIDGLSWTLEPQRVVLRWTPGKLKAAFTELVKKSFWLEDGFIRLAGLERDKALGKGQNHFLYEAILHCFFSHGPYRPTEGKKTLTYDVDEKFCFIKDFKPIKEIKPYKEAGAKFITADSKFRETVECKGWLYPGGGKRHEIYDNTTLYEPVENALALMYAPVGVVYYRIRSRAKSKKARYAMVIPEIKDLTAYCDRYRRNVPINDSLEMTASSASDAALRFITQLVGRETQKPLAHATSELVSCRVMTFGIVAWDTQHKTRTYTHTVVTDKLKGRKNYDKAAALFPNSWQKGQRVKVETESKKKTEKESHFVANSTAREFISDNIAHGRAWYHDLATFLGHKEVRKGLSYKTEREALSKMVKEAEFEDETERLFIQVCQESWRRRMGKLSERASGEGAYRRQMIQKDFEKLRVSISRCRNAHTLRETIVEFWARVGRNELLQGSGLQKLLPLFEEKNWRKSRDLALLALISYQPTKQEKDWIDDTDTDNEGEELSDE